MRRIGTLFLVAVLLTSCATRMEASKEVLSELAPTGKIRVGLNLGNVLLVSKGQKDEDPRGVVPDLARELGTRLGVPVEFVPYAQPGLLAEAASSGKWDVAFLAIEPARAKTIHFSEPYVEIETAYLVRRDSLLRSVGDVDSAGVRVAVALGTAYDLFLTRSLKAAQLSRTKGTAGAVEELRAEKADAVASLRQMLSTYANASSDLRLIDGDFMVVPQAIGTPVGRDAAARYLGAFIQEIKKSGFLGAAIERNAAKGLRVAP